MTLLCLALVEASLLGSFEAAPGFDPPSESELLCVDVEWVDFKKVKLLYGGGSKPIIINSNGMNIHLPAILMFTRGTRF